MKSFNKRDRIEKTTLLTAILSASIVFPLSIAPVVAKQDLPTTTANFARTSTLPAGTRIPIQYRKAEKILLTREESYSLSLTVTDNIKNDSGKIVIPSGSEIIGEIRPNSQGSRFFSQKIVLKDNNRVETIDAVSDVLTRLEKLIKGADISKILKGALLGRSADAIIASFRDDRVLGQNGTVGSGLEILAGWLLRGESIELLSIDPRQDLKLTLRSDFGEQ